jgi:signal transduction histidine kinase/ligand-binding sensor domain-containing protein
MAITQFVHTSWTELQGAPSDIRALAQTKDGYLWLGTTTGLFHFDGVRFVRLESRSGEEPPPIRIRVLLGTRDGSLWIVSATGVVSRLLNGHLKSYSERDGMPPTLSLVECNDGTLIAGTANGLARFKDGVWEDVGKKWGFPGKVAHQVYIDKADTLWVVAENRIYYLPRGQKRFEDAGETKPNSGNFAQGPNGTVWIAETRRSAHSIRPSGDQGPLTEVLVGASRVLFDRHGTLWISTIGDGLLRIAHPSEISGRRIAKFDAGEDQFTAKEGLSGNYVTSIVEDREGNIWSASLFGLDRFRASTFVPVSIPNPDLPRAIIATRDGGLWTFSGNPVEVLRIGPQGGQETVVRGGINSMAEDHNGALWMTYTPGDSHSSGLSRFQRGRYVSIPLPGKVELDQPTGITSDPEGGIWLLDWREGLFRFAGGAITKIASLPKSSSQWGYLSTDRRSRIWMGRSDHVSLYDHGKWQEFGPADGVPPGLVLTIYEDRGGNIWVGGDGGLSKFEDGRLRLLHKPNGFPAQSVFGLAETEDGYWWIATDAGVLQIPAGELDHAAENPAYRTRYKAFGTLDGLPGRPRTNFPMPVVSRTTDGRIWFATSNGIAYADPHRIPTNELVPPVHVEAVKVDGKEVTPTGGTAFLHGANDLEIDYTALSLTIPERVFFRYKLEGSDTDWHDAGTRRQAFYNHLGPKRYRFRVMACNNDGVWNLAGASFDFSVAPAYYQTNWFRAACVAAFLGLLWALYEFRLHQLNRQFNMGLEARVNERTRIARELHDTLLQSFQGLLLRFQAVSNLLPARPDEAKKRLDSTIDYAAQAITEGRDAVHELRSSALVNRDLALSIRTLGKELSADLGSQDSPIFHVQVEGTPLNLDPALCDEVYWVAAEGLRNAFRHSQARHIEVEIRYDERRFRLRIRDDGRGIDPRFPNEHRRAGHWGLGGMRERAKIVGGHLDVWSELNSGTEVELTIPASSAYPASFVSRHSLLLGRWFYGKRFAEKARK